jgi:hypothetical protein
MRMNYYLFACLRRPPDGSAYERSGIVIGEGAEDAQHDVSPVRSVKEEHAGRLGSGYEQRER